MNIGRNDPCHCGSGKKYKKCHYQEDEDRGRAAAVETRSPWHELDHRFVMDVLEWARGRYPDEIESALDDLASLQEENGVPLLMTLLAYHVPLDGRAAFERYTDLFGHSFSRRLERWIGAQRESWLGIWEVQRVVPGKSMTLRDLLTGEVRLVHEATATRTAGVRDALLARVVDVGDESLLGGLHPYPLPPADAQDAIDDLSDRLELELPISPKQLRDYETGLEVIAAWEDRLDFLFESADTLPAIENSDGDPIRMVIDTFRFAAEARQRIESALRTLADDQPVDEADERVFTFMRDDTVTGTVFVTNGELRAETNSVKRADAMRTLIEPLASFTSITRAEKSVEELLADEEESDLAPPGLPQTPEIAAQLRALKELHYERWLDDELPALGGSTPREAVRTERGRREVAIMLKDIERIEARVPEESRFDVAILRRALKIEE